MLTPDRKEGLGVALNEASWAGVPLDEPGQQVTLFLQVLTLPADGSESDPRRALVLRGVHRVAGSLRHARWDDAEAAAVPLALDEVSSVLRSFDGLPVYGWEFIDIGEDRFAGWSNRVSFDAVWDRSAAEHYIDMFQDSGSRIFDMRIWFDEVVIEDAEGTGIDIDTFIVDRFGGGTRCMPETPEPKATASFRAAANKCRYVSVVMAHGYPAISAVCSTPARPLE